MKFRRMPDHELLRRLSPPEGRVRMVLDTDAYNEIDDQFALTYSLLSPERMDVKAIYAAPFTNRRSRGPGDGMEKSYEEILRVLSKMEVPSDGLVHRGSTSYLPDPETPCRSEAAEHLVELALGMDDEPLYVVAIGAITNVASAIIMEPKIVEKIVVVWLGGQPLYWPSAREFNLGQDIHASRTIFDCGVPLVQVPCQGVTSHMMTTISEMERYVLGRGAIGDYLYEIFRSYYPDHYARSKVIWDIAAVAYLINPSWVPTHVVHSPILTDQFTWSVDTSRHFIRTAVSVDRDAIFGDFFRKLEAHAEGRCS